MILRRLSNLVGWLTLCLLLLPLGWATWVSFTPDEFLRPPISQWSFRWYFRFFSDPRWNNALVNSLTVALGSTALALFVGTTAALAMVRHTFWGKTIFGRMLLLPLCVPTLVLGMGLLPIVYLLGLWGSHLSLIFAHGCLGMPLVYLTVSAGLRGIPSELIDAARGLGATPGFAFWKVTLPLCRPGLVAGGMLSFVLSLNEFFVALFIGTPQIETLPRVVWPELRYTLTPLVSVASVITLVVTMTGCLLLIRIAKRGEWFDPQG